MTSAITESASSDEYSMRDLPAELNLEICSYLDVHDQEAMRKVCKSWRLNLSQVFLSKYVAVDASKIPNASLLREHTDHPSIMTVSRSDSLLQHTLNTHVQKKTKVLVIRHMDFIHNTYVIVARVITDKETDLIQLIFKDCATQEAFSYRWAAANPQRMVIGMRFLPDTSSAISFSTRKLILDNYTIRNILSGVLMSDFDLATLGMPSYHPIEKRLAAGNLVRKLPIVVPWLEFDCSLPLPQLYCSFIMAVEAQTPEVNPQVRRDVAQLCSLWSICQANLHQWLLLDLVIKCLSADLSLLSKDGYVIDIATLRHLDPLTLNKLTTEALHRLYCLPPGGLVYHRPTDSENEDNDDDA